MRRSCLVFVYTIASKLVGEAAIERLPSNSDAGRLSFWHLWVDSILLSSSLLIVEGKTTRGLRFGSSATNCRRLNHLERLFWAWIGSVSCCLVGLLIVHHVYSGYLVRMRGMVHVLGQKLADQQDLPFSSSAFLKHPQITTPADHSLSTNEPLTDTHLIPVLAVAIFGLPVTPIWAYFAPPENVVARLRVSQSSASSRPQRTRTSSSPASSSSSKSGKSEATPKTKKKKSTHP